MSSFNCCFLTCIQVSQEAGQVVCYSHLFKNFPQFIVIHTVKGFGIVNKAEIDVFLELSSFSMIQQMLATWSLVLLPFLKPAWTSGSSRFMYCWCLAWRILSITSRKSRNTWSNRQIWPWSTKWSRAKANTVLPRERAGHSKHPLPTIQETILHIDITRWSIPKTDWLYSLQPKMEKFYTVSKNKTGSWLWLRSWNPYCQIQTEIEESGENHQSIQVWPKSNPLWLYSESEK